MQEGALAWRALARRWGFLVSLGVSEGPHRGQGPAQREKSEIANIIPSGCPGCPAKLSFGSNQGLGFSQAHYLQKLWPENIQLNRRNVAREAGGTGACALLSRALGGRPAPPRVTELPASRLPRCWRWRREHAAAGRGASRAQPRELPRVQGVLGVRMCSGLCVCCPAVGCVSTLGEENYPHLRLQVPCLEAEGRFLWR